MSLNKIERLLISGSATSTTTVKIACRRELSESGKEKIIYASVRLQHTVTSLDEATTFLRTGTLPDGKPASTAKYSITLPRADYGMLVFSIRSTYSGSGLADLLERVMDSDQLTMAERQAKTEAERETEARRLEDEAIAAKLASEAEAKRIADQVIAAAIAANGTSEPQKDSNGTSEPQTDSTNGAAAEPVAAPSGRKRGSRVNA